MELRALGLSLLLLFFIGAASAAAITINQIGISPNPPVLLSGLTCWANSTSSIYASFNYTGNWTKDGILQGSLSFSTGTKPNATNVSLSTISYALVLPGDNWSCRAHPWRHGRLRYLLS